MIRSAQAEYKRLTKADLIIIDDIMPFPVEKKAAVDLFNFINAIFGAFLITIFGAYSVADYRDETYGEEDYRTALEIKQKVECGKSFLIWLIQKKSGNLLEFDSPINRPPILEF